ncbi:MAG: LPS export ABC transporter periplasmic protein LptC [Bacteroidetes bacterium]|nr:MAG: LPS export ABC transporter periplasmic protein LptC [Bacteroidota bacterium]
MRTQRYSRLILLALVLATLIAGLGFSSCSNKPEEIAQYSGLEKAPMLTADSIELLYTQHGRPVAKVRAKEMTSMKEGEGSYDEFPRGIEVYSYSDSGRVKAMIRSNYAKYERDRKLWDARNNVVAVNEEGDSIHTEQIYWDEANKRVYTNANVRIRKENVILYGKGFESDDRFKDWEIREPHGVISIKKAKKVKDDEEGEE